MTTNDSKHDNSLATRAIMLCWALVAALSAVGFATYAAMLPFAAQQPALLVALTLLAILSVVLGSVTGLFCSIMNIGFGVVIVALILGGLTHFSPTIFLIGITMFTAILTAAMWTMSSINAIANLR